LAKKEQQKEAGPRGAGRPSVYSEEVADEICERMIEGEELVKICKDDWMPARSTVYRWMANDDVFRTRIACAREGLADHVANEIANISASCTDATANADRVKLAALQWRASKLAPRKYSDKHITEISGPNGNPIEIQSKVIDVSTLDAERRQKIREALLALKEGNGS
jgi:hypothetical protein